MRNEKISIRPIALLLGVVLLAVVVIFARWVIYSHRNEFLLIAALTGIYCYLGVRGLLNSVCFSAIVSLSVAIFNPVVIHFLLLFTGLRWTNTAEHWTFFYGIAGVIAGHIALRRTKRAPLALRGRTAAVVGLVLGYALIVGCIVFLIWLGHVMAGMSPV